MDSSGTASISFFKGHHFLKLLCRPFSFFIVSVEDQPSAIRFPHIRMFPLDVTFRRMLCFGSLRPPPAGQIFRSWFGFKNIGKETSVESIVDEQQHSQIVSKVCSSLHNKPTK